MDTIQSEELDLLSRTQELERLHRLAGKAIFVPLVLLALNVLSRALPALRAWWDVSGLPGDHLLIFFGLILLFQIIIAQLKLDRIRSIKYHLEKESANNGVEPTR